MQMVLLIFLVGLLLSTIFNALYDILNKVYKLSTTKKDILRLVVYIPFLVGFYSLLGTILYNVLADKIQLIETIPFELFIRLLVSIVIVIELFFLFMFYDEEIVLWILSIIGIFAGGLIGLIFGKISGEISSVVASGFVGFIIGRFYYSVMDFDFHFDFDPIDIRAGLTIFCIVVAGIITDMIYDNIFYDSDLSFFEKLFSGIFIVFFIGGMVIFVCFLIFGITQAILYKICDLLYKSFSPILFPIIIKLIHQNVLCDNCLHISKPLKSNYEDGERYCEHCGSSSFLKNVKCVIGLIGSNIEVYQLEGDKFYINLWDKENEIARNADINILEIRNTKSIKNYDFVINSVYTTLYNDVSRDKNYLKGVSVIIKGNPRISEDVLNMLKKNFKEVSYA